MVPQSYFDGAVIEASSDATTWNVIGTLDKNVHVGWNSLIPNDDTPYRYIRFAHTSQSKCKIAEFEIYGY